MPIYLHSNTTKISGDLFTYILVDLLSAQTHLSWFVFVYIYMFACGVVSGWEPHISILCAYVCKKC